MANPKSVRRRREPEQKEIVFPTHGGRRRGAGRKPVGDRPLVSHRRRGRLSGREPVLVTMKVKRHVWNLRTRRAFERLLPALTAASQRLGTRVVQFSVQHDHLHLLVEPASASALGRAMNGLAVRIARRINAMMGRKGRVFADRLHARVLETPRAVRTAIAYVLCNFRKHGHAAGALLDPFSSAAAFDGWAGLAAVVQAWAAAPGTWLLRVGWRRAGATIDPRHVPGALPG